MRHAESHWALYDGTGGRKYLCASETPRFLQAARRMDGLTNLFCCVLLLTGCRISEALALTPKQLDAGTSRIVFRTLKRRRLVFRAVPVPGWLIKELCKQATSHKSDTRLWSWSRQTAWRRVKAVMDLAGITGPQAMPKGLRHGFGVANAELNVPMPTTRKWMGHSTLETTAIYQDAVGREEQAFAQRLWRKWQD